MSNHESYDDQSVFEKLEQEATRHKTKIRYSGGRNNSGTNHVTRDDGSGKNISKGSASPREKNSSSSSIYKKASSDSSAPPSEMAPDPVPATQKADFDLSSEIQTDLQQTVSEETTAAEKPERRTHHHSKKKRKTNKKKIKKQSRFPRWARVTGILLALVLILGAAGFGVLHSKLNKIVRTDGTEDVVDIDDEFDRSNEYGVEDYEPKVITSDDVTNILLIGQDRRKGDKAQMRSDSMIVCSINTKTKEITLTSLMRDMYLPIPGKGYGMINATYLAGGFPLLNETIEKNFGIHIDGNVEVDFERFIGLMTLIGPIDLELTQAEADHLNQSGYHLKAGVNTLDSEQVLAYCRMRKDTGGDWGRTDRQRKVVSRIYQELKTSGLSTIYRFIDEALPLFRTDLSNRDMIHLAYVMVTGRMGIRHSYRLPEEGTYTQEIREETLHVLIPDVKENCKRLQKYIYGYLDK